MSKVVVIGTSNSVMKNAWVSALSVDHEVINLSCGRLPVFFHIKTILENMDVIRTADLLVFDHYINDLSFYYRKLGDDYKVHVENLYSLLGSLGIPVINALFPIKDLKERPTYPYYEYILELTARYGLYSLDLNKLQLSDPYFKDRAHILRKSSYLVGMYLGRYLNENILEQNNPYEWQSPYQLVSAKKLADENGLKVSNFKNSLMEFDYVEFQDTLKLTIEQPSRVVSIGYLADKASGKNTGIKLGTSNYGYSGNLYFHETLDEPLDITEELVIEPIIGEHSIKNLMGRGTSDGVFTGANLVEVLLYRDDPQSIKLHSGIRKDAQEIELPGLSLAIEMLSLDELPTLGSDDIDIIRDSALALEDVDIGLSYKLMEMALILRPNGKVLRRKIEKYLELLD